MSDLPHTAAECSDQLSAPDSAALDEIAQCAFDLSITNTDSRGRKLGQLLGLIDLPKSHSQTSSKSLLVDVVMARVLRQPHSRSVGKIANSGSSLQPYDAEAIDELVESGWTESNADQHGFAAQGLCQLLAANQRESLTDSGQLIERTLTRVQDEIDAHDQRLSVASDEPMELRGNGFRLADLASVAAILLIGAAVFWPMLASLREDARMASGKANLESSALAFSIYAGDHRGRLPQAHASFLRGRWWDVGEPDRSHSANLFRLVSGQYASMHDLSSPGNPNAPTLQTNPAAKDWRRPEEVSFSYQLFSTAPQWGQNSRMVVLTDRSPAIDRARRGEAFSPDSTSLNHPGRGQHVLFSDGAVLFFASPKLPWGDHLWLPASLEGRQGPIQIQGHERPASEDDAFVGP